MAFFWGSSLSGTLKKVTDRKRKIHRRVIAVIQSCYEKYVIRNKDFYGSHR